MINVIITVTSKELLSSTHSCPRRCYSMHYVMETPVLITNNKKTLLYKKIKNNFKRRRRGNNDDNDLRGNIIYYYPKKLKWSAPEAKKHKTTGVTIISEASADKTTTIIYENNTRSNLNCITESNNYWLSTSVIILRYPD